MCQFFLMKKSEAVVVLHVKIVFEWLVILFVALFLNKIFVFFIFSFQLQDTCDRVSGKKEIEDILKSRESSHLTSGLFLKPCSIHKDSNRKHRKRNKNRTAQNDICESTAKLAVFETQNSIVSSVNSNMFSAFKQDSDTNIKVRISFWGLQLSTVIIHPFFFKNVFSYWTF